MKCTRMMWMPAICLVIASGCNSSTPSRDVSGDVRRSLDQAGLKDVSVSQDRDKGVVTLQGEVASESDKAQAEGIAKSFAAEQVIANEIAVHPAGDDTAKDVQSSLDDGIKDNLNAQLTQNKLDQDVDYSVNNGVVTLTGNVTSQQRRARAAEVAKSVPNVKQVVNELEVTNQKATSTR